MEGIELHPIEDDRGVNRFDPDEVEQAALRSTQTSPTMRVSRFADNGLSQSPAAALASEIERELRISDLEQELKRARRQSLDQSQELERTHRANAELRECLKMCADLLLGALSLRQLEELGDDGAMLLSYLSSVD